MKFYVGIELSSIISSLDVDLGKVTSTSDLDVVLCFDKVNPLECAVGNEARSTTGLEAPRDVYALSITDGAVRVRLASI